MGADVANFQYHRSGGRSGAGVIGAIGVVCIGAVRVRGAGTGLANGIFAYVTVRAIAIAGAGGGTIRLRRTAIDYGGIA